MKLFSLLLILLFVSPSLVGQGVAINATGAPPDASAMLDVQSGTKGVLIPRMSTAQRIVIPAPAIGLLVYDTSTRSYWFKGVVGWVELTDNWHGLQDVDHDTKVQVEESPDEDIIRFDIGGVEAMVLGESSQGATRLNLGPDLNLFVGHNAGLNSVPGWNTFLGYEAGYQNTTGYSNTFTGFGSGATNLNGFQNTFVGMNSGHNNAAANGNTFTGYSAGYNSIADRNTFYGFEAGLANRTGLYNTVIGGEAAGNNLANRNMGNGNSLLGYEAGQSANGLIENVLVGYRAGYNITNAVRNVLIGANAGYSMLTAYGNVAMGPGALRTNVSGSLNVSIGDSTLYNNTASGNVALGSKAGLNNTTGSGNTFLGRRAGGNNTTGGNNTFVGDKAGINNSKGIGNVALGTESGYSNSEGNYNAFIGFDAGFRNDLGDENIFIGKLTGEHNLNGLLNIAIGSYAMNQNDHGSRNIAIGEYALGNGAGNIIATSNSIAIGAKAGQASTGSSNIIIGNDSGHSLDGTDNVLLGNNISSYGYNNTLLGTETGASPIFMPNHATAVGYGTQLIQDYSVILGDATVQATKVGIGTMAPEMKLHIEGSGADMLKVSSNGNSALRVLGNRDVIVDHKLMINTAIGKPGYEVSVNGRIACEELLVEASEDWPDYVFSKDYSLMSLKDLHHYLEEHNHLPGIPSAADVEKSGVKVAEMQKGLLEKIEELTLYIINLESRIQELESK